MPRAGVLLWGQLSGCNLAATSMNELMQLKRVLREVATLRAELIRVRNCPPASSQIIALPDKTDSLHKLNTLTDPLENQAALESALETIEVLTRLNVELRKSLNIRPGQGPDALTLQ